jgi:hypothetical protein
MPKRSRPSMNRAHATVVALVVLLSGCAGSKSADQAADQATSPPATASQAIAGPSAAPLSASGSVPGSVAATVGGEAKRIGADPAKLLARVSDGIGYEIYPGVFRGSAATLADRVGNDADKALLLRDLLRAAIPNAGVRFASCTLGQDQQNRLIATAQSTYRVPKLLAEDAASLGGKIKNPAAVALLAHAALVWTSLNAQARDQRTSLQSALQSANAGLAAPSPDVRDALANHVWVQQQNAGQWVDLDPALAHAKPGAALCTAQSTMDDLPDAEYDTIAASVRVEQRHGGALESQVAVQGTWRTAQLEGASLSFAFAEPSGLPTPVKAPDRPGMIAYTPILRAGTTITAGSPIYVPAPPAPASQDPGSAVGNVGTSAVNVLSDTPATPAASPSTAAVPSSEIVGAWLELSVTTPGTKPETVESAIFDRVAFADRAAGNAASAQLATLDDGTGYDPAFESLWNIGVSAGTALAGVGDTSAVAPKNTDTPAVIQMIGATQRAYYSIRRALFAGIAGTGAPAIVNAQPGLSLLAVRSSQKGGSDPALLMDVASDHAQPVSGDASTGTAWAVSSLLAERAATAGDKMVAAATAGTDVAQVQTRDVLAVFDAARKANVASALVRTTTDINGALPPAAKARLASSLSDGRVAFAPAAAVDLGGRKDYGWWIVGPGGTLRDEMQSGRHQAGEDAALNRNAVSAASRWHKLGRTVCFVFITMNAFGVMSAEGPEGAEAGEQQADTIMSTYDENEAIEKFEEANKEGEGCE